MVRPDAIRHISRWQRGKLTHGNAEEADGDLDTGNYDERVVSAKVYYPPVRAERETEAEEILEDQQTRKCLNGNFSYKHSSADGQMELERE